MAVCDDDEAMLKVASVGTDPYHLSSCGFCQMELLLEISELQRSEVWHTDDGGLLMVLSVKRCLPTHPRGLLEFMLISLFNSLADLSWSV